MKTRLIAIMMLIAGIATAQQKGKTHNYRIIQTEQWILPNSDGVSSTMQSYKGSKALVIKKSFNNYKFGTVAYPKGLNFTNGEIELDMASGNGNDFLGLAFRIQDLHHYQTLYFRPASTGTINAIQYMPEKKNDFNWWDYEAEKYQANAILPSTGWFHVKAVVKGNELRVYVNHETKPAMVYKDLDPGLKQGSVGYWFGNSLSCAYKNLTVKTY